MADTLTISELIAVLQARMDRHGDLPVLYTWEDTHYSVLTETIYAKNGILLLDADYDYEGYSSGRAISRP